MDSASDRRAIRAELARHLARIRGDPGGRFRRIGMMNPSDGPSPYRACRDALDVDDLAWVEQVLRQDVLPALSEARITTAHDLAAPSRRDRLFRLFDRLLVSIGLAVAGQASPLYAASARAGEEVRSEAIATVDEELDIQRLGVEEYARRWLVASLAAPRVDIDVLSVGKPWTRIWIASTSDTPRWTRRRLHTFGSHGPHRGTRLG